MKFAILAAGEGSRLANEGSFTPKPLTKINGEAMIDRLLGIFSRNGADEIIVIVNKLTGLHLIANYNTILEDGSSNTCRRKPLIDTPVRLVSKTTKSSMHSFFEISGFLKDGKFCLTTVDTIFRENEFAEYIKAFKESLDDGLMAVTPFVDDEKPLYVATDENMNITAFNDENLNDKYVSGGIYSLTPKALQTLESCIEKGMSRMRNFQRQMIADGLKLKAYSFGKIIDVDHIDDVAKAEQFINEK
mgnify:FL=1